MEKGYFWLYVFGALISWSPYLVKVMARHDKAFYRSHPRVDFAQANADNSSAISYKLFTKENPDNYTVLTEENVEERNLNKNVKTILMIHGWTSNEKTPWYTPSKEAYFRQNDYNIISVDWSEYGNMSYSVSSANVKPVGEFIAVFLKKSGVPAGNIHVIGHSLGSHLGSFIGKAYKTQNGQKIGRITALDPAGSMWSNKNMSKDELLNELDAEFVDVIHTDIQMYGYTLPRGHVDFYPNGGTDQPGCPDEDQRENCNHHRSALLFKESINTQVTATEIDIKEDKDHTIVITHKDNANRVIFGEHINSTARGVFYFKTGNSAPYLKNIV